MKQGIYYNFDEAAYHADPCDTPSLSAGIIKPLLNQSPAHAAWKHPGLNPNYEPENKTAFDFGKVAHSLMLGDVKKFVIIEADSFRTKAAQEQRDAAYEAGSIPILKESFDEVTKMVDAGRLQLVDHECSDAFHDGQAEVTAVWQEDNGVWCRIRLDYVSAVKGNFYDYKTTDASANPEAASKLIFNNGYDITSAFYKRGIRKTFGIESPNYRFIVQEKEAPFCLSAPALSPQAEVIADRKIDAAVELWGKCLESGKWPGYTKRVAYVDMPSYLEAAWLERELREDAA